ncbi:MAG TPA: RlpA-like double-psi beta-barrel domain-containing protein [Streptosporangiaceae bacterium]|nr:RlpA-like double-psi beta-barrel domain-containing protein [Streptosporangiaceae bacterium]
MHRRATTAILMSATGTVLAGSLALTAATLNGGPETGKAAYDSVTAATGAPEASEHKSTTRTEHKAKARSGHKKKRIVAGTSRRTDRKTVKKKSLPTGRSTATSFWDPGTASGKPMRYKTLASPYWPLGTKVRITYRGKSVVGEVQDFGPAEWAVKQHSPPAIVDLSEKMMADLTGSRGNVIRVGFKVLKMGSGPRYVKSGTGYNLAWGSR